MFFHFIAELYLTPPFSALTETSFMFLFPTSVARQVFQLLEIVLVPLLATECITLTSCLNPDVLLIHFLFLIPSSYFCLLVLWFYIGQGFTGSEPHARTSRRHVAIKTYEFCILHAWTKSLMEFRSGQSTQDLALNADNATG